MVRTFMAIDFKIFNFNFYFYINSVFKPLRIKIYLIHVYLLREWLVFAQTEL
jgi:hypothetical protein